MEIVKKNENGSMVIDSRAMENMAEAVTEKIKNVIPVKAEKFAECKLRNEEIIVTLNVKLIQGCDVDKTCKEIQKNVYDHIYEMTSIKVKHVDVLIQGFESKSKKKEA